MEAWEDFWIIYLIQMMEMVKEIKIIRTFKRLKLKIIRLLFSIRNFTFLVDMMARKTIAIWEYLTQNEIVGSDKLNLVEFLPREEMDTQQL